MTLEDESGVRTELQERSYAMHVVRDVMNSDHGPFKDSFLFHIFTAFEKADSSNFALLQPAILNLIGKYNLKCKCSLSRGPPKDD